MIARDQLLGQPLGDIRVGPGRVADDELDLQIGRQVLLVLLDVEPQAFVHLIAGLRERPGIRDDQADLDGVRHGRCRACTGHRSSQREAGDDPLQHQRFPHFVNSVSAYRWIGMIGLRSSRHSTSGRPAR